MVRPRSVVGVLLAGVLLALPAAAWGAADVDIRGAWRFQPAGAGTALADQVHVLTTGTTTGGVFSGDTTYPDGGRFGTVTYTVDGLGFTAVNPYTITAYTATWTGTISADGQTMSGTWSDTLGQRGGFTATRTCASAKTAEAKQSSQACPPRYTPEQKRYAEERRRAYANSNLYFQGMAVAWGGAAVYFGATGAGAVP
ncbi:MAG: hypothetical protein MUE51_06755, partial [Thermoleophilia bacterium]|nr:hypothetical protein [Thermoleophilia bacterium]